MKDDVLLGNSSRAIITHRARITFPTDQSSHLSHKCIPWLWRCYILGAQYEVLPFYPAAVWNDESGLLRQTKPHAGQGRTPFHYNGRNFSLHLLKNPKWFQQRRAPCSPRMPGHYRYHPENYLFISPRPLAYITHPNSSSTWVTMIPSLSHWPTQDKLSSLLSSESRVDHT